jgi:Ca2+-transporting ATPase
VVGVTGDGTNDAPALKLAHVGFAMKTGTDIAKGAADMVLLDDNFATVVTAIKWGRSVNDNIRKFLQFQLTINVSGVMLTVVASLISASSKPPFTPVQLLWLNLIMDTLAALALATESPEEESLLRRPVYMDSPLVSRRMWTFIAVHASWQFLIIILLHSGAHDWFNIIENDDICASSAIDKRIINGTFVNTVARWCRFQCADAGGTFYADTFRCNQGNTHSTLLFNTFIWTQVVNVINARKIYNEQNPLEGILTRSQNLIFIFAIIGGLQTIAVFFFGDFMGVTAIGPFFWGLSLGFAGITIPVGIIQRLIPAPEPTPESIVAQEARMKQLREEFDATAAPATQDVSPQSPRLDPGLMPH